MPSNIRNMTNPHTTCTHTHPHPRIHTHTPRHHSRVQTESERGIDRYTHTSSLILIRSSPLQPYKVGSTSADKSDASMTLTEIDIAGIGGFVGGSRLCRHSRHSAHDRHSVQRMCCKQHLQILLDLVINFLDNQRLEAATRVVCV